MATNRDLAMVNAAIKQQNTMQTRIAKMQQGAMYANNTAESLLKGAKKAGYTVPASAYQQAVQNIQNTQQTAQQSGGITAESLMNEYQQWLGQQSNQAETSPDLSSGGYAGAGYQQYLQNNQQIPSLNSMSNEDLAKQINIAEMVKNQTAQSREEQDKNVADILAKLNNDSSMVDKAKQLINQRNTDYTKLTGKTDYDDAVQRTLQSAIPSLADSQNTAQPTQSTYSNEDIAKIIAQASGNSEADILNQLNSSPELVQQAKTMLAQRDSDYAALMQQDAQNAANMQQNSATAKPTTTKAYNAATAEYKKAQTATAEAKKKVEAAQKKLDDREKKIQSLEKSLEKAKKSAQKTGHYEQVNAIQQQIRGMQDTSADNEAFKKATDAYNRAKQTERLKQANQALLNPTFSKKNQEQAQTAITAPNGTFNQRGEDFTTTSGKGEVTYNDDGTVTMRHGNDTRTTKNGVIPSLLAGFGNGFTDMGQKITKTVARAFGTPEAVDAERNLTEAQNVQKKISENNPKSYMAGNVAGTMLNTALMYNMANAIGDNMGATDAAKSVIQRVIPSLSGKALDTAANIMVGQAADTLLDTTPTAIEAYQNGASPAELANTIAENQIQNLAGNFVGESISAAADKPKTFLKANGNTAEDAVSNIAKNANLQARPDIQYQSPEDASKEFTELMNANAVKTQSAEEADAEARQLLSQYLNGEGARKDRRNKAVSSFMNKTENTPVSDEEVGSIIKAAQQNQVNSGEETRENLRRYFGRDEEVPSLKKNKTMAESIGSRSDSTTSKIPEVEVDVKGYDSSKTSGLSNKSNNVKPSSESSFNDAYSDDSWDALLKDVNGGGVDSEPPKYKRTNTEYKIDQTEPSDAVKRVQDRMDSRPDTVDNEGYIGREYTNTLKNSGLATKEQYEKGLEEQTRHFTQTEKQSFNIGKRMYDSDPEDFVKTYSARMDKKQLRSLGASDIDAMSIAYGNLNQAAKNATDPAEAATLRRQASSIARNLTDAQHYNGQALQASAKWKGTADGAIMSVDGTLQNLRDKALSPKQHDQIDDAAQKIADMLRDMVDGKGSVDSKNQLAWQQVKDALDGYSSLKGKLSDKQIKNFTDSALKDKDWNGIQDLLEIEMTGYSDLPTDVLDEATKLLDEAQKYNFNSKNYMDLESKAYKVLANGIQNQSGWKGESFGQKVDSWRYLMMLGNPKTMIKNEVGNKLFGSITEAKDDVGSIIEASVDRINKAAGGNGIDRTKTLLNRFSKNDKNLISAAKEYGENNAARALSGNKYLNPGEALNRSFDTFGNSAAGRALQKMSDTVGDILDNADQKAMMEKYQHAMARYVKANGYDASIFKDGSEEAKQFLENASAYAVHQAEEAAFHQDSGFSSALTRFVNSMKGGNVGEKIIGNAVDATIPFKKTPTNVLKSALQYSPLEYGWSLLNTRKLVRGEIKPSEYIDMISKATTGSVMLGVGALLAHEGIVQIGSNKGTQESNTDTRTGLQGSSLNFNIGGKNVSVGLSDLTPASSPLIMGATLYESIGKKRGIDAFMSGLTNVANGLIDMSMLQGISGLLESQRYADDDELPIATLGKEVASNYAGQFLSSLGRAVNTTANDTATSSYSDKEGFQKFVEQQGRYLETKVPGLQQIGKYAKEKDIPVLKNLNLEPAIDAWGNEKKNNAMGLEGMTDNKAANVAGRGVSNFLSPTKVTTDTSEEVDNKIRELKNNLVDSGQMSDEDADELFPYTSSSEAKIGDGKLSPSDWTTYQKEKGKLSHELATELLTSGKYDDMDDLSKAETLTELYKFAKNYESAKFGGSVSTQNQSKFTAYEDGGAAGLIEAMRNSSARSSFNAQVKASNKDGKAGIDYQIDYLNAVQKQDASAAKEMAAQASDYQKGTFTLQGNKWVYKDAKGKVTKTGTGATVSVDSEGKIPSVADYQSTGTQTKASASSSSTTEKIPSLKGGNDMSKYIAAHKDDAVKYSATSTVGASGYDYKDSDRFKRVKSLGKVGGVTMNGYNYEKAIKEIDTDGSGRESKAEITTWINNMADKNGWDQETKRKVYAAFAPKNYKNPY